MHCTHRFYNVDRAMDVGCNRVVLKPCLPEQLEIVRNLLASGERKDGKYPVVSLGPQRDLRRCGTFLHDANNDVPRE
jgi:hypothetical protein